MASGVSTVLCLVTTVANCLIWGCSSGVAVRPDGGCRGDWCRASQTLRWLIYNLIVISVGTLLMTVAMGGLVCCGRPLLYIAQYPDERSLLSGGWPDPHATWPEDRLLARARSCTRYSLECCLL